MACYFVYAAGQGIEPRSSGPKPDVLPLHHPALSAEILYHAIYPTFNAATSTSRRPQY